MRKTSQLLIFLAAFLFNAIAARAQFIGYVGLQTNYTKVVTVAQSPGRFLLNANIGASTHTFTYCLLQTSSGTAVQDLQLFVEESPDGTSGTFTQISPTTSFPQSSNGNSCGIIRVGGYYSVLAVNVPVLDCFGTVPCTVPGNGISIWYTGTAGPIDVFAPYVNSFGSTSGVQCDQSFTVTNLLPGASYELLAGNPHQAIYVCGGTLSFNGATTAGQISLESATGGAACNPTPAILSAAQKKVIEELTTHTRRSAITPLVVVQTIKYTIDITANTPQLFAINSAPNSFFKVGAIPNSANLCIVIGAITASTSVTLNWAQF